jgi:hypothetical protein
LVKRPAPRTIILATVSAVVLLLVLSVGVTAGFMPGCAGCHLTGAFGEQTAAGAHSAAECSKCHGGTTVISRLEFGVSQVFGMYLPLRDVDPTLAQVTADRCQACHADEIAQPIESDGLRIEHKYCAENAECTSCHSPTAHGSAVNWPRTFSMDPCYACHAAGGISIECDTCHAGRLPNERTKTGAFAVTHGPDYLTTHGMGKMSSCAACHDATKCQSCHGVGVPHGPSFVQMHGDQAASAGAKCTGCHIEEFCSDCHTYPMPHPADFTPQHADITARDGQDGCLRCHAESDCVTCHVKHVHPTTLDQLRGFGVIGSAVIPDE